MTATVETGDRSTTARYPRRRTARYALLLGSLTAFGPLAIDMYLPALPSMANELRSTDAQLQLTLAVFLIGLGVGQLIAGPLSDALGRRRPLLVGVVVFATASAVCALSPSIPVLIAGRAVQAMGAAAGMVIARAVIRDLFSGVAMARFLSTLMLVTGAAPILAPMLGGQLLRWTSWRGIFFTLTAFGIVLLVISALSLPETLPARRRRSARFGGIVATYGALLRDRVFTGYAVTVGLAFAAMFSYISASSFVLQHTYGLTASEYGLVFACNGIGLVVTGQVNGRLVSRFAATTLLRTGLLALCLGAFGLVTATLLQAPLAVLLVPLFVAVSAVAMIMPNATTLALQDHPHTAGSASALLGLTQFLIGGGMSPVVGLLGDGSALPMALTMAVTASAAFVVCAVLTRTRHHRPHR